jgi:hypothetical protein
MKHFSLHMRSACLHFCWFPLAAVGLGCGSQASEDYLGESLISLGGSVVVDNPEAPEELVPVLLFETRQGREPSNRLLVRDVVHRGEFPSRFQLSVFDEPPAAAIFDMETDSGRRAQYAWANIAAVAPEHPAVLALTSLSESSHCIGRECYTERTRCDTRGSCYEERDHCSLPARFDERSGAFSNCREIGTRGNIATIPVSFEYGEYQDSDVCTETSCQLSYEWCVDPDSCEMQADGSCRPPAQNCYARLVQCDYDPDSQRPAPIDELEVALWAERDDLSNCSVVMRQGNFDYAASYHEWLAGTSRDAHLIYLPEGFDPVAFEEVMGLTAPEKPGYSLLVYAEWDAASLAEHQACDASARRALVTAYNLEHGTDLPLDDLVAWGNELVRSDELSLAWAYASSRCENSVRGAWHPDPLSADLELHVDLPPAFAN